MGRLISEEYRRGEYGAGLFQSGTNDRLTRFFVNIYGSRYELTPDFAGNDISVRRLHESKNDASRSARDEIISLISYAVGCMFGRYSPDADRHSLQTDEDNIIPICAAGYFENDITSRFIEFIRKTFGDDTLEENLRFIADTLGGLGTPTQVIRSYFINDFYADHLRKYHMHPIYQQFDSGKGDGFKCLIYMHRFRHENIMREWHADRKAAVSC